MRLLTTCLAILLVPTLAHAQGRFSRATSIGRVDSVWSATLKENRPYLVYTPPSYDDTTTTPQRYPVLYLLDGDAHFHSVSGLIQILSTGVNGTYAIPEMILVAIPNTDRMRDMTPSKVETGLNGKPQPAYRSTGGMSNFLSFVKSELIPHIDERYRTTSYRVFVGHSLGGITAINALYTIPETFNAYVAIDPSLWWDNGLLLRKAKDWATSARVDKRVLYVAQANTNNPDDTTSSPHFPAITRFNAVMQAYHPSGLRYAFKYYEGDDHGSVPLVSEYDALRFIFDGYQPPLSRIIAQPQLLPEHFRNVSERLGAPFVPSERMVHSYGQLALGRDTTKAMEFFQIATELYPTSTLGYDRLGALWAAKGDRAKARAYFEQSLARNPANTNARVQLKKLAQ
jgi:uncharacterized protein